MTLTPRTPPGAPLARSSSIAPTEAAGTAVGDLARTDLGRFDLATAGASEDVDRHWVWTACGPANDGSPADLRGLTALEAKGGRLTVWYEENHLNKHANVEQQVDVPYSGQVLGIHYRDGLSVRFDHAVGADGKPERIHISNEDDWMWGVRRTKAAVWTLEEPAVLSNGREQHIVAQLI